MATPKCRQQAAVPTRREERAEPLPRAVTVSEAQHDEDRQHQQLGGGEESLYGAAAAHAQNVQPGKQQHHQRRAKLEARQAQFQPVAAETERGSPHRFMQAREEVGEVDDKTRGDGGNRGGLGDDELRPAVEESEQRAVSAVHVNEFAARLRQRRAQFRIAERSEKAEDPGGHQHHQHHRRRAHLLQHDARNHENRGPDHGAGHHGGGAEHPQAFH